MSNSMCSAPPQGFGSPGGMMPPQTQYHQTQQQQQATPIYSTQLSQGSYGSNQVSHDLNRINSTLMQ